MAPPSRRRAKPWWRHVRCFRPPHRSCSLGSTRVTTPYSFPRRLLSWPTNHTVSASTPLFFSLVLFLRLMLIPLSTFP
ncbi:hypothetical protein PHYSODRAFT_286508 [Phytophthora sojae]|uniref:Uncharacterized protein n=1 Tax=Phytophthora sojae (strain P6497) TaxID=1094619 RepID=G4ZTA3_PHYSP|nr:hypothetical protein PHYSODRAFT_286508 [Phytophthora sojae]EGZ12867.1 hypothetical protein PHYSODRAFT_286508 [Phytophthora sojae]|eukprot:XP_009530296.1 hypothetical protein PHYSODRAFT_286508 [Phytophthora sojae]